MNHQTAILFFSRTADCEASAKWSTLPQRKGRLLSGRLIDHTRRVLRDSGLPVYWIDQRHQVGATFGERLDGAINQVLRSHRQVIVVGGDSPGLSKQHIDLAVHQLRDQGSVIGPNHRGGIYLLGLNRTTYRSIDLQAIEWQTEQVTKQLMALLSCPLLPTVTDIHCKTDILAAHQRGEITKDRADRLLHYFDLTSGRCTATIGKRPYCPILSVEQRGPPAKAA